MNKFRQTRVEAPYIAVARLCVTAKRLAIKAKKDLLNAKRSCASLMNGVHVREFEFSTQDGKRYSARLERPTVRQVSVRKLYTLLANGEIDLDTFLDCVTAVDDLVKEAVGDDTFKFLQESVRKGLDLIIEPIQGDKK